MSNLELGTDEPTSSSLLDQDNNHYQRRTLPDYLLAGLPLFMQYVIRIMYIWCFGKVEILVKHENIAKTNQIKMIGSCVSMESFDSPDNDASYFL